MNFIERLLHNVNDKCCSRKKSGTITEKLEKISDKINSIEEKIDKKTRRKSRRKSIKNKTN